MSINNEFDELKQMMEVMPGGVFRCRLDNKHEFCYVSDSLVRMLGFETKQAFLDMCNNNFDDMLYDEDREKALKDIEEQLQFAETNYCEYRVKTAYGIPKWIYNRGRIVTDDEGNQFFYVTVQDADEVIQEREMLSRHINTNNVVLECVKIIHRVDSDASDNIQELLAVVNDYYKSDRTYIFEVDDNRVFMDNTYECCAEGAPSYIDDMKKIEIEHFHRWLEPLMQRQGYRIDNLEEEVEKDTDEYQILSSQGVNSLMVVPMFLDMQLSGFLGVDNPRENQDTMSMLQTVGMFLSEDIQRRNNMAFKMNQIKKTEPFTGLLNKPYAYGMIREILEERPNASHALLFIDFDDFKRINDSFGHDVGDKLILGMANILQTIFRRSDVVARVGGDEFVVFMPDVTVEGIPQKKAKQVCRMMADIYAELQATCSIGISISKPGCKIEDMLKAADEAMYHVKKDSKNGCIARDEF